MTATTISDLIPPMTWKIDPQTCWEAVARRDGARDGEFVYGVLTTGVFCRPSCASRMPRRENVRFFRTPGDALRAGLRPCLRCRPAASGDDPNVARIVKLCRFIEDNLDQPLTLAALGREAGLSGPHLQRSFKAVTGVSPRQYADACRMRAFKNGLRAGSTVTEAMFDAGYSSSSRLYEKAAEVGMTPQAYRQGAAGEVIRYDIAKTTVGWLAVAMTARGVCAVQLGAALESLRRSLKNEFPKARLVNDRRALAPALHAIEQYLDGERRDIPLPVDIAATAFQKRVWEYLRAIPYGETRTYSEVAKAIGAPSAARAVARACATNPVALVVPCHRVVRTGGALAGYRWGVERKRALLDAERDRT